MRAWSPDGSELKSGWVGRQTGRQTDGLGVKSIKIDGEWDRKWHWASRWVGWVDGLMVGCVASCWRGMAAPGGWMMTQNRRMHARKLKNLMKLVKKRSCWVNIWQIGDGTGAI